MSDDPKTPAEEKESQPDTRTEEEKGDLSRFAAEADDFEMVDLDQDEPEEELEPGEDAVEGDE